MKRFFLLASTLLLFGGCSESDWMGDGNVFFEPKAIVLSKSSMTEMIIGENRQLHASFSPAETTKPEITWTSDDQTIATVDQNGMVVATGLGQTVITAQSVHYPTVKATCMVSVDVVSGIRVYDLLLDEPVVGKVTFVRNLTGERDYYIKVFVHNTFDESVTFESTNPNVIGIEPKQINGLAGFTLKPGQQLGDAQINIQSVRNDDVRTEIPISLKTIRVTDVALSLNPDGSNPSKALTGELTVSHTKSIRVMFSTDDEIKTPENCTVAITSSDTSVATVDAQGTLDPATQTVSFNVYMVDNPANAPSGVSTITLITDDGGYEATFTVTAKCPGVQQIVLNKTLSEPILKGKTLQLSYTTVPEDAYIQSVKWTSENEQVATVDAEGLVTINPDLVFDPENRTATEINITATSDDPSGAAASCKLRPYDYVPATGVMVTDQWGNRIRGTSSTNSKINAPSESYACIQYCAGSGKNKTDQFADLKSWAVASPAVAGVDKVGSIAVYLTATPYPYTYPWIADPDQPFYWACYSNSRFSVAGAGYEEGNQALGWTGYSKDDGKSKCFLGHTCKFWTGHSASTADVLFIRVWRYKPGVENSSNQSKELLLRFSIHTTDNKGNDAVGNPKLTNADGTARVFAFLNTSGIPQPFADECPFPWTGPLPTPGKYYTLDDSGAPDEEMSWGEIPVPNEINEIK